MATGYVTVANGSYSQAAAIAAWELEAGVTDCVTVGGIGAKTTAVADEISNGVIKLKVTAGSAAQITDQYDAGDVITGLTFETAPGEDAPA